MCVFQLSFCGSSSVVVTGRGSTVVVVVEEFFSYYFFYNLSDKSRMLERVTLMLER